LSSLDPCLAADADADANADAAVLRRPIDIPCLANPDIRWLYD
jgi:hypothetical protein